jgi:DNA-binding NarL/FixJ family response regulator
MLIRVLIADDHVFYREGVRAFLENEPDIEVVGEAGNGEEVLAKTAEVKPDVILMDLKMPGINGIEATRRVHETNPEIGVLALTMFDDDDSVFAAMRAGARGYLLKDAGKNQVVRAIVAVKGGEAIFSPAIAGRMIQFFSAPITDSRNNQSEVFAELTEREIEILDLVARGQSNKEISNRLSLSVKTVQNYVSSILAKLQVADRIQAMMRAREAGMGRKDNRD